MKGKPEGLSLSLFASNSGRPHCLNKGLSWCLIRLVLVDALICCSGDNRRGVGSCGHGGVRGCVMQVKELVSILEHLDYAVYVAHNHNAAFEDLVNDVAGLFERSQDSDALAAAAAALAHCAQLPQLQLCEAATQTAAVLRSKAVDKLDECAEQLSSISDAAMKVCAPCYRMHAHSRLVAWTRHSSLSLLGSRKCCAASHW